MIELMTITVIGIAIYMATKGIVKDDCECCLEHECKTCPFPCEHCYKNHYEGENK